MTETIPPLPSLKTLFISTLFAIILAIIILIFAVLPAEYGIDLTGFGKYTGLTKLATIQKPPINIDSKKTHATTNDISIKEVDPKLVEKEMAMISQEKSTLWKDTVTIIVPASKGLEYKFFLEKKAIFAFEWETDGAVLSFDFHGEPKGDKTGYFKSFKLATKNKSSGTLTAPFAGSHGWYWENKTDKAVKIILKTKGNYQILGLI